MIEFLPETHGYLVDGVPKRSLSSILDPLREPFPELAFERVTNAKHRGAQVDDACSLIMEGKFTSVHDELLADEARPYVEAYREFWTCFGQTIIAVQTPLYCATLDFCCTPDWAAPDSVNDIKATAKPSRLWGLQTAGQQRAHGHARARRIIWLRPHLKSHQYEVHSDHNGNPRIFSPLDHQVLEAACQGDYDAEVVQRWRAGA